MNLRKEAEKLLGHEGEFSFSGKPERDHAINALEILLTQIRLKTLEEAQKECLSRKELFLELPKEDQRNQALGCLECSNDLDCLIRHTSETLTELTKKDSVKKNDSV